MAHDPAGAPVHVRALPWPVVELLVDTMRKLAHDLTNAMVAGVSMVDLTLLKCHEPAVADHLQRLRGQLLRPRTTIGWATASLPMPSTQRPPGLGALERRVTDQGHEAGIELRGVIAQTPWPSLRPRGLDEDSWGLILHALLQNALDAHAAAALQGEPPPDDQVAFIQMDLTQEDAGTVHVRVVDNAEGCADLNSAATGRLRRSGNGHLGLGLAVAAAIAERAGGCLTLAHHRPRGLIVCAEFPNKRAAADLPS